MKKKTIKFYNIPPVLWMLAVGIIVITVIAPSFFAINNFKNILIQVAPLLIISIGSTMVILSEEIDLSFGGIISLSTVLWITFLNLGIPMFFAILLTLLAAAAVGAISGIIISKGGIPSFIVTLGMASITSGIALVITQGSSVYFSHRFFYIFVNGEILFIPIPLILASIIFAISWLLLNRTKFGAQVFGLGGNRDALSLGGIGKSKSTIGVFSYSGLMAGITGLIIASKIESGNPTTGAGWEFDAIAATLIGGTSFTEGQGGIGGTILGVLLLIVIRNGLNVIGVNPMYQSGLIGSMVLLAIIIDVYISNYKSERFKV
ncbi:MAG: ABC transporter permease [Spirochaetales bacterium]|nr:ABC transporter permease [Spirochaetales bacterium]